MFEKEHEEIRKNIKKSVRKRSIGVLSLMLELSMAANSTFPLYAVAVKNSSEVLEAEKEEPVVLEASEEPAASETP